MKHLNFLFYVIFIISVSSFFLFNCSDDSTSPKQTNNGDLTYVTPEDVGYSSAKLSEAEAMAEQSGYAAMMAVYDGKVFFEWGDVTVNYLCHSIRKPFLSSLYGIHINAGNIDMSKTLAELNIDDISPSLTDNEKLATIKDLLMSRSGVYHEAAAETQEMKDSRPERDSHEHGTFFYYNNWDFNALGTIFEQETSTKIFEEFESKIGIPIGMQDFSIDNCYYRYENNFSEHPAYHFRMSTRDMARFGILYQQNGVWNDKQIVPSSWINESTMAYSILDSATNIGYGYMWNIITENSLLYPLVGSEGYYHTGIGVHVLMILPEQKLVIVQRYDTDGEWTDPGEIGMQIGLQIINSKL